MSLIWNIYRWASKLPPDAQAAIVRMLSALVTGDDASARQQYEKARLAAFDELARRRYG